MKSLCLFTLSLLFLFLFYSCNKNESAPVVFDQEFSLAENSETGTIIGAVEASDADEGQIISFEIIEGNSEGTFEMNPENGILSVSDPAALDYESNTEFVIRVGVTDNHVKNPRESTASVRIILTDVNEYAPILNSVVINIDENPMNGREIVQLNATDEDIHQSLSFSIIEGNEQDYFHIDAESGVLTVLDSSGFDYETNQEINIIVKVEDNHSSPKEDTALITVTINDVLEITDGLMGYYPFNGNAMDESGNENHGVVNQAILTYDRNGLAQSAYQFDGIDDYITLGDDFDFQERSISIHFKADQVPVWDYENNPNTSWASLITSDHSELLYGSTRIAVTNIDGEDKIWANVGGISDGKPPSTFCVSFDKSQWQHVTLTVSNLSIKFYVNGALIHSVPTPAFIHSVDGIARMMVGVSRGANYRFFDGMIDDIYIHNRSLEESEILTLSAK
jgi:hypothetical protein